MNRPVLSIIIPCYNEEATVSRLFDEIVQVFSYKGIEYEIIFVDDGSTDGTMNELNGIISRAKENAAAPRVKVVEFSRNFGKEAGMYAGMCHADGEYTVIMDGDLQHPPQTVADMLDYLQSHPDCDCVACVQKERKESAIMRFFKRSFYKIINKAASVDFVSDASDFRMMRRPMVDAILSMSEYYRFSKGIFSFVGFKTHYMPYQVRERGGGSTKWSVRKLFAYAIDGIIGFTTAPLKFITVTGTLLSVISFLYLAVVVIKRIFFGDPVQGFATTVGCILLLGGLQLLGMGIIGEYLGRTYVESKHRPIYIKRRLIDSGAKEQNEEK